MERLTTKDFESDFCSECRDYGEPNGCNRSTGTCDAYDFCSEAWDKLADYKNTGLTPDEITVMRAENERLETELEKHIGVIADKIIECGDSIKIALETQDRKYLKTIIRQWRGTGRVLCECCGFMNKMPERTCETCQNAGLDAFEIREMDADTVRRVIFGELEASDQ